MRWSSLLVLAVILTGESLWAAPVLEASSHCVAYKARKTMLFVRKLSVVGRNCDVSAQVLPEVGGLYNIEVNVPIRSFNSGDSERDRDVMKILKADVRPELTFKTAAKTADQWRELFAKKDFELEGELFIGDKSYPLRMKSSYIQGDEADEISGWAQVRFQDFGLKPPKVVAGILVSVKPELELYFNFVSTRILGADSIRLQKEGKQ